MNEITVTAEQLKRLCHEIFYHLGLSEQDSTTVTDVMVMADLMGIDSHGIRRLSMIDQHIQRGYIDVKAHPNILFETPVSALVDGSRSAGQVVSVFAMQQAIDKATKTGVGLVTVRNSNHYGIAGYYSRMASDQGLIGVSMTNSLAAVVPTLGSEPMLGTNPIAFSIPSENGGFHLDMATSVVSVGKIELHQQAQQPIPWGWGLNKDGENETDPLKVLKAIFDGQSGLHPLGGYGEVHGGHKGYGLSMVVEILSAICSSGRTSNHIEEQGVSGVSHFFMAIDPKIFGNPKVIQDNLDRYLNEIRNSSKAKLHDRIYIHGEKEMEAYSCRTAEGILISEKTMKEINELCQRMNINIETYFD